MIELYCGDALIEMKKLPKNSYDFILLAPPFGAANMPNEKKYFLDFDKLSELSYELLKDGGVCVFITQDVIKKQHYTNDSFKRLFTFMNKGFTVWAHYIYWRGGIDGYWWNTRPRTDHDYVFVLTKNGVPPVKYKKVLLEKCKTSDKMKCIGTVLDYRKEKAQLDRSGYRAGKENFPVAFPEKFIYDLIISFTNEDDLILDPFMGTGTTIKVAQDLNRNAAGIELLEHVFDYAKNRIENRMDNSKKVIPSANFNILEGFDG